MLDDFRCKKRETKREGEGERGRARERLSSGHILIFIISQMDFLNTVTGGDLSVHRVMSAHLVCVFVEQLTGVVGG